MKKLIMLFAAVCFTATLTQAQSARYTQAMEKQIALLDSTMNTEGLQKVANSFERIANAEKTEWLPYYYAAYAMVMQGFMEENLDKIDPILDKADGLIQTAASLKPNYSEITAIEAMILSGRMRVDGSRAMSMGPKSSMLLQKAMGQQPIGNPRVMMNLAQNLYYTPEAFGGGKKKGLEMMEKALAAYDTFEPATSLDPNWGKEYVASMVKQWKDE